MYENPELIQFLSQYNFASDSIELYAKVKTLNGMNNAVAQPLTFKEHPQGRFIDPFIRISNYEAQGLMDSLWEAGIRPASAKGSAGQLTAVQYHLEDMRKLVFNERVSTKST